MSEFKITVLADNTLTKLEAKAGSKLSHILWAGKLLQSKSLCDGLGQCGKCKVKFINPEISTTTKEKQILTQVELEQNIRLSCQHQLEEDLSLQIDNLEVTHKKNIQINIVKPNLPLKLAVDLGTSSIHWQAWDQNDKLAAQGQNLNPQAGVGSDIISRLSFAKHADNRALLSQIIKDHLNDIIQELAIYYQYKNPVTELCIAANTALTSIMLNLDITSLSHAPYACPTVGNFETKFDNLPMAYIPVQPAPFIGGDISAGMAQVLYCETHEYPLAFIDMGTNGECVLAVDKEQAFLTSVPLGPALEGTGLSCGALAEAGSIDKISLGPSGLQLHVLEEEPPKALCGTGAISLLAALRKINILSSQGKLQTESALPLVQKILKKVENKDQVWKLKLAEQIYFNAYDLEAVLKVRAALVVAINSLLKAAKFEKKDLKTIIITGSLGKYAPIEDLIYLGFIPKGINVKIVDNAALQGAALFLRKPEFRNKIAQWSQKSILVDVTSHNNFINDFTNAMCFE